MAIFDGTGPHTFNLTLVKDGVPSVFSIQIEDSEFWDLISQTLYQKQKYDYNQTVQNTVLFKTLTQAGQFTTDPIGSILTLRDDGPGREGSIYKDGKRLGTARVKMLIKYGNSVYGKGYTDSLWYQWNGTSWVVVPITTLEPGVFN